MDPADLSLNRIFDAFTGYQRTAALKAAIEIDLFTAIGSGVTTLPALASRCGAAERGVRSLANRLVVDGFLTKDGEHYGLAPDAAVFLDGGSAACVGSMIHFLTAPRIRAAFDSLTAAVRRGGTALDQEGTLEPNHPVWVEFARAMAPAARMTAEVLAMLLGHQGPLRGSVLDVAAGHGFFGITLARHNPELRIVALDWPAVLEVAAENAREAGVTERFTRRAGSAFDVDWGTGHAVVLLTNFLHHFEPETCETLLRRTRAALAPGGRAVVVEFVTDDSRVNPPAAAVFSLTMLASTPAGDAYTLREYERMFAAAGFSGVEMHQLAPTPQQVLLATA
jgi:2-polyprenyl-3-methyl-5-hydroxy-6-metoxy-1,4-benzoquinol methylase